MVLGIYGSGGLGREVLDLVREISSIKKEWSKIVFINDFKETPIVNGIVVCNYEEFTAQFPPEKARIVIAIGEPKVRQTLREKVMASGYGFQTLVHPTAFVGSDTQIGEGTTIQYSSFISCNVNVGTNVLLQPFTCIGHNSVIGNDAVISSCAVISGTCVVGERAFIGLGVSARESTTIGSDSIVGMGSVVFRDVPEGVIALGNPARAMKNNESGFVFK